MYFLMEYSLLQAPFVIVILFITRKHSRPLFIGGVSLQRSPWTQTAWTQTPGTENPQKEHGTRDRDPPLRNMGPDSQTGNDIIQRPTYGQTDTCENITLP